jgi:hypothetical protein
VRHAGHRDPVTVTVDGYERHGPSGRWLVARPEVANSPLSMLTRTGAAPPVAIELDLGRKFISREFGRERTFKFGIERIRV